MCIMAIDRHTRRFAPQIGHWNDSIFLNQDGSVGVMLHLGGLAADLAGARAIVAAHLSNNQLARNVADPRIEWWDHFVRQDGQDMSFLPEVPIGSARALTRHIDLLRVTADYFATICS